MSRPNVKVFCHTVESILCDPRYKSSRSVDVVEVFAGVETVKKAACSFGLKAVSIDKDIDVANHDLTTERGFLFLVTTIMMVVSGGLTWMAPVCSSMGFPTQGTQRGVRRRLMVTCITHRTAWANTWPLLWLSLFSFATHELFNG